MAIDFEAEGLLQDLEGEERESRLRLLRELEAGGATLPELRAAVQEDRLALLPVERFYAGSGQSMTADEVAREAAIDADLLRWLRGSLGLPMPDEGARAFGQEDIEAARRVKTLLDAGLPRDGMLEISRAMGLAMSQLAAANRSLVGDALIQPGDTEHELAHRYLDMARTVRPLVAPMLGFVLDLHMLEQIRRDAIGTAERHAGHLPDAPEVVVCFADLVGFTRLGERLPPDELSAMTGRFGELAAEFLHPPARLVKLIGDAAMLVSPDADSVVSSSLALLEAAEREGDGFPAIRVGAARGRAVTRGGDWYGSPVNAASRVSDVALPGSVLVTGDVKEAVAEEDAYAWSYAGERRLRGIEGRVKLFRCRRGEAG